MDYLKKVGLIVFSVLGAYIFAEPFGRLYDSLLPSRPGMFVNFSLFFGFVLCYIFILPLLFSSFGGKNRHVWLVIFLIPALVFEIYFDLIHIYFPLAVAFVGWLLGFLLEKGLKSIKR